ncbi:response regulator [Bradyrhizobium sp. WSM 1791]|uniref:Response regulator n=1 Tax=Bradyrhizobium australiense TaxID=2721161 RepID=A0A7Y4LUJ2_9BRAD|nr:response regulator [Bradyrhizobium australiense]
MCLADHDDFSIDRAELRFQRLFVCPRDAIVTTVISCVDDDSMVLEALQDFLDASGFDVAGFSSAEEFLALGRLDATSCLITDVRLGGMSGLQLQDHPANSGLRIPVIIISAFAADFARGGTPRRRTCACHRPLNLRISSSSLTRYCAIKVRCR